MVFCVFFKKFYIAPRSKKYSLVFSSKSFLSYFPLIFRAAVYLAYFCCYNILYCVHNCFYCIVLPLFACKYCFFIELGAPYGQRPTLVFSVLSFHLSPLKRRKGWSGLKIKDVFPHSKALRTVVIHLLVGGEPFILYKAAFFFLSNKFY